MATHFWKKVKTLCKSPCSVVLTLHNAIEFARSERARSNNALQISCRVQNSITIVFSLAEWHISQTCGGSSVAWIRCRIETAENVQLVETGLENFSETLQLQSL